MTVRSNTFKTKVSQGPAVLVTTINSFLANVGLISLLDFDVQPISADSVLVTAMMNYMQPGSTLYTAQYFEFNPSTAGHPTIDTQVAAYFVANPTYRPRFIRPLTDNSQNLMGIQSIIMLIAKTFLSDASDPKRVPVIVRPTGNIPVGSAWTANVLKSTGVTGTTISVINGGDDTWPVTREGYAIQRDSDGAWVGVPNCCP
jgi:hypothetical protein